jgi:membrane protease subunit (stomatin/prohibitin family)
MDTQFQFPVNVGAFGQWGFRICDARSFVTQIVGSQLGADSTKILNYFIGEIIEKLSRNIAVMIGAGKSVTSISAHLTELSTATMADIRSEFLRFGIEVVNFSIASINIAQDEMRKIQEVMAKRMEMNILGATPVGQGYVTVKSLEIMKEAAQNPSAAGGILAAGAGLGMGMGAGFPIGQQISQSMSVQAAQGLDPQDPVAKLSKLKSLLDAGLITQEEFATKKAQILSAI